MWQYWGHGNVGGEQLARLPSLSLTPEQGLAAVEEETVVPNHLPDVPHGEEPAALHNDIEQEAPHIYFKDLKLLAHDHGEDSEEEQQQSASGAVRSESDASSIAASPTGGVANTVSNKKLSTLQVRACFLMNILRNVPVPLHLTLKCAAASPLSSADKACGPSKARNYSCRLAGPWEDVLM